MEPDHRFLIHPECITSRTWPGYKLILPTVSVGQVGQLTVDLLLSNLGDKVNKVGDVYSDALLPIVGRQLNNAGLCTGLEIYECHQHKLVILQQRAPFVRGRIPTFRQKLLQWVSRSAFAKIVVFGGVSSHIRKDSELVGSPFRFLTTSEDERETYLSEAHPGWREYAIKKPDGSGDFEMPGSGIMKSLYEDCVKDGVSLAGLIMFCNPGNTIREAMELLTHVLTVLEIVACNSKHMKMPSSWNPPGEELRANYIF